MKRILTATLPEKLTISRKPRNRPIRWSDLTGPDLMDGEPSVTKSPQSDAHHRNCICRSQLDCVLPLLLLGASARQLHECVWPRIGTLVVQVMVVTYIVVCTTSAAT